MAETHTASRSKGLVATMGSRKPDMGKDQPSGVLKQVLTEVN
jgi:hypothetical protein